ncbi:MAG: UDP-glucose 4-epimerase GalE [Bacteroidales bacterium]|nr:UDP-glucose 4-epimerase GalE [Bacteroidales bacterium]
MDKIVVTGGAGYIGSITAVELLRMGFEVLVVDNFANSSPGALGRIGAVAGRRPMLVEADCADAAQMRGVFAAHPDVVGAVHFAALKSVAQSVAHPLRYYRHNVQSTMVLLDELCQRGLPLVYSSSCLVYGRPERLPVSESTPLSEPASPYASTKRVSEGMIAQAVEAHPGLRAVVLRYFNPIGAHPSGLLGERPNGRPENLIPLLLDVAMGRRDAIKVFGSDYPTRDGTCIRDYFHVVDLAQAHVLALGRLLGRKAEQPYEVFNIGSGSGVSVLEMIDAFEQAAGRRITRLMAPRRPGDIPAIWADTAMARDVLGWRPQLTLHEALRSAWLWASRASEP